MIKLFVGLGNPGPEYAATRHNAGFWWIDALARELKVQLQPERSYWGLAARATVQGQALWLLQPQTFMNLSGKSVGALARFFKIQPEQILVAHDELDFAPRHAKLKTGASHGRPTRPPATPAPPGSHAAYKSNLHRHREPGRGDDWRLRLGIGHPGNKSQVTSWVLKKAPSDQQQAIEESIAHSLKAWPLLVAGEMDKATAQINTNTPPRPKPPRQERKEQS